MGQVENDLICRAHGSKEKEIWRLGGECSINNLSWFTYNSSSLAAKVPCPDKSFNLNLHQDCFVTCENDFGQRKLACRLFLHLDTLGSESLDLASGLISWETG